MVIFALNQTLLQQESRRAGSLQAPYTTEDLIKHYNCGDLNSIIFNHDSSQVPHFINATLPAHERTTAQEIDNYFRQELIYKRNERMGRRVKDLLEEFPEKSFFFAFGAGHFMGNNTVIDVLRRYGYDVHHTPAGRSVASSKSKKTPSISKLPTSSVSSELLSTSSTRSSKFKQPIKMHRDKELLPDLLMSDNVHLMDKAERKYKKKKHRKGNHRQFSDLWVRIQDSVTDPPPQVRIINGYITVEPQPRGLESVNSLHTASSSSSAIPPLLPHLFFLLWNLQQLVLVQ